MSYSCKILLDSISETGKRLSTFEVTFPRIVLAEFNTHRMFSRNSASSRAIPFKKRLEAVSENPFIPDRFPIDGKGMQPNAYIDVEQNFEKYNLAKDNWLEARDCAVEAAESLYASLCMSQAQYDSNEYPKIHKQIVNRLLEPFQWHTVIVTATEFDNFFKLRTNSQAQYEIKRIADLMYKAYHSNFKAYEVSGNLSNSPIQKLEVGEWHCPLVSKEDEELIERYLTEVRTIDSAYGYNNILEIKKKISVARCARVSYLTQDGKRDIEKDLELFERLRTSGHWSPFEHVATPFWTSYDSYDLRIYRDLHSIFDEKSNSFNHQSGNFLGWKQYRKEFQDENCTSFRKEI